MPVRWTLMGLWMLLATAVPAALAGAGTAQYVEARAAGGGLQVSESGTYTVWIWAPAKASATVHVGDHALNARIELGRDTARAGWAVAGTVTLEKDTAYPLRFDRDAAAIAVGLDATLDPAARFHADCRVLDAPDAVEDRRARVARHTDTVFTMPHFDDLAAWEPLAERLRRRVLLSSGLWPLPEKTPLNAQVFDQVEREGYRVAKVHFEARPGQLVTGNLYRPIGNGPFPAIVCPHGHWEHGRLEESERGSVPARCITLARMGAVVFSYDMVGYVDNRQFEHRWGGNAEKVWGIHPFAVQLWNGIRALDFVASLPEVDPERLGCTGASGGGTQTFALTAVDPRVKISAPVNMISSTMQGGCVCENAPILRLENSNMEIGALMAPRPMIMVSATGDWTRETPRVEFPAIRSIYQLYDAQDRVQTIQIDAGHNYNQASREAVYRFFGPFIDPAKDWSTFTEPPYPVEDDAVLRVFPGEGPLADLPAQAELIARIVEERKTRWAALTSAHPEQITPQLLTDVTGAEPVAANDLRLERTGIVQREGYVLERWILGRATVGDAIPALFYRGKGDAVQDAVLLVHGEGKAALADAESGGPGPEIRAALAAGKAVLSIDAYLLGEQHSPYAERTPLRVGGFQDTFHLTETGERIQDILTAIAFLRARRDLSGTIALHGHGDGSLWALFAGAIDGGLAEVGIDAAFESPDLAAWATKFYIPCILSIGGVDTAKSLLGACPLVTLPAQPGNELS